MTWAAHRPAELYKEEFDKMASWKWKAVYLLTGRRCFYVERICLVSYGWEDKETPSYSWEEDKGKEGCGIQVGVLEAGRCKSGGDGGGKLSIKAVCVTVS